MPDFTLDAFMSLTDSLAEHGYAFYTVQDWLTSAPETGVMLRHDVDRKPKNALTMARAEHACGIRATYYFRMVGSSFDPKVIRAIHGMGHEVGYHYEDLSLENGDMERAYARFERNLETLREIAPITTIAMHGRPFSPHDGRDMWKSGEYARYGLSGEAFLTPDYAGVVYFTDTGRRWDAGRTNLRDRPPNATFPDEAVRGTDALKTWIRNRRPSRLAISAHPERWDAGAVSWLAQSAQDRAINAAKLALGLIR